MGVFIFFLPLADLPVVFLSCVQKVHPFQFLSGRYTDDLYEAEVRVCAQGFVGDKLLKAKVDETAVRLFSMIVAPDYKSETFQLYGITFKVTCAIRSC